MAQKHATSREEEERTSKQTEGAYKRTGSTDVDAREGSERTKDQKKALSGKEMETSPPEGQKGRGGPQGQRTNDGQRNEEERSAQQRRRVREGEEKKSSG